MSSWLVGSVALACIVGGVLAGMLFRRFLPDHHVKDESKDVIKLGAGLIATMAALVLGLLVSSAKSSFDAINDGFKQSGARVLMMDQVLGRFGPETKAIRVKLKHNVEMLLELIWPTDGKASVNVNAVENSQEIEIILQSIRNLTPANETQRTLQAQAIQYCGEIMFARWLMIEHTQNTLPLAFFVIVVFWLTVLHAVFGMLSPPNRTVLMVLLVSSLSVSAALFLVNELNRPVDGLIRISNAPLIKALQLLGK